MEQLVLPQLSEGVDPKKLADDHWDFLNKTIKLHDPTINTRYMEYYFKAGFIHGYKHSEQLK